MKAERRGLLVLGRYSRREIQPNGEMGWALEPASERRAAVAVERFRSGRFIRAIFSAGWPGAEGWPVEHVHPLGKREATGQAQPLLNWLHAERQWTAAQLQDRVRVCEDSFNCIGDVRAAAQAGHLEDLTEVEVVCGALNYARIKPTLRRATQQPLIVARTPGMHDIYGREESEFVSAEGRAMAAAKEVLAIGLSNRMIHPVRSGDLRHMREVEDQFGQLALYPTPGAMGSALARGYFETPGPG